MANPDRLHITYHPARRSISFTVYEGDTVVNNTYESLTKYSINKKHEFVLNLCGDDFLDDILHPFVGKDAVDISMTTTRLDYEDFLRQVDEYNSRHFSKIRLHELDPNNELPDMTTSFNNIKEQGEKIVSLLDEHWSHIQNINCKSISTKKYMNSVADKLTVEKKDIKRSLKSLTEDNNVNLCLVGVHSSGKSTLINTLLGYEILPVDIRPETAKVLKIKGVPGVESIYVEFSRTENQVQKTCKIGWDSSNHFLIIKDNNMCPDYTSTLQNELFKNRMKRYDEQVRALLDYLNPDESVDAKVDLGFPLPFESTDLKFTLYDTPGTDSNIAYHQQILSEALNQTNSILLFVLEPYNVAGSGNVTLMNLLLEKSANPNNSIDLEQSFFIFNKIDSVKKTSDIQKLKIGQLKKSETDINPIPLAERKVFFLSASNGFAAIAKKNGVSNADWEYILEFDCKKSLNSQYGCYYQHNHFGKSKYITELNLDKTNKVLESETNELDKYIISSGIYSLVEAIKDYGLRYASTVKTSAIIKSIESAADSVSTIVKETSLGTDERVQDIYLQLESEKEKIYEIIKETSAKYEVKTNLSTNERKKILSELQVDSDSFEKSVIKPTQKIIDERLEKPWFLNLKFIPVIINDETEILLQSDIERLYKRYIENYKEKRTAYLIERQNNFIKDFMDMVEKSEISEKTKEKLKDFKYPNIPEFEIEKKLKELFETANFFEYGALKNICKKIAHLTSGTLNSMEQKINKEKEESPSLSKENLNSTELSQENKRLKKMQENVEEGFKKALEGSKVIVNESLKQIDKGMQKIVEKVDPLETKTLNKDKFKNEVEDWMQEKQAVITENFWEDLSSALNQMCEDLSKEFRDNIELYSTRIKALEEEHEPLVILSENIIKLQNSISHVQFQLDKTTKGVNL